MKKRNLLVLLMASMLITSCDKNKPSASPSNEPTDSSSVVDSSSSSSSEEVVTEKANGAFSYVAASYEERTEILGKLEKFAVDNYLTGITIYENGGYVMYDTSVKKGTNTYIPGYGFGVVTEGEITADLAKETNANWKRYYHTYEAEDPMTLNYMNDDGSVVGDYIGYIGGSFWDTQMNETKDGYEWAPKLAVSERPIAVNADADGLATKYKFEVKVGSQAKYGTASTKFAQYNGREIALEDYITPYKILYTQAYGMKRGADQLSGTGSIKGTQAYYNASDSGYNEAAWNNVGLKSYVEDGKSYLEVEFNQATNQFYAMYYLAGSLTSPVPEDFIKDLGNGNFTEGVKNYQNFSSDLSMSPVDTTLSSGPYMVESWSPDQEFVFKRNPYYVDGNRFKVAGIHVNILKAAKDDPLAGFNQFIEGYIHATSLPKAKLAEYKTDPRTTTTVGDSTSKLNLNTCTQEVWNDLFGKDGSIYQTEEGKYWECKPIMSNKDFVRGLSYAINRLEIASTLGVTPSINYFGSSYLSDPENGVSYNSTPQHAAAIADLLNGTDEYGYSEEKAKAAFKKACDDLIAAGVYKVGDTIELEATWQSNSNIENYGDAIKQYWESAFNSCGGGLTLSIKHYVPNNWQDAYTKKMQIGHYDIGIGGINGNPLNPLNFLEVLKSDNSSRFTLNWGLDTNVCDDTIEYDGKYWSFDALWKAADQGAYVENGEAVSTYAASGLTGKMNDDGTMTLTANIKAVSTDDGKVKTQLAANFIFTYSGTGDDYTEDEVEATVSADGTTVTIVLSKELVDKYKALPQDNLGIDFYFYSEVLGTGSEAIVTLFFSIPV